MERKIGEIFEYNGEWYQCVESQDGSCKHCDMNFEGKCPIPIKKCTESGRSDKSYVIFKKLEKVGEPYERYIGSNKSIKVQRYRLPYRYAILPKEPFMILEPNYKNSIEIEIKQTKEDMEENKLNLKPFDIQKAREGKPVCTRDGRKARIICFDRRLFYKNVSYPILALVERSDGEDDVCGYNEKGKVLIEDGAEYKDDLMMLPEKKEGWVNVYNADTTFYFVEGMVYDTKEEAIKHINPDNEIYITTVKVQWEE